MKTALKIFFEKLQKDKKFKKRFLRDINLDKEIIYETLKNQEMALKKEILPFAKENDLTFSLNDIISIYLENILIRLNKNAVEKIHGGKSPKFIAGSLLATGLLSLLPPSVSAFNDTKIFNDKRTNNVISVIEEQGKKYRDITSILNRNTKMPQIDEENPFNEVDALVFSILAYMPITLNLSELGSEKEHITIKEAVDTLFELLNEKNTNKAMKSVLETDKLCYLAYVNNGSLKNKFKVSFEAISKNDRYKDIKIGDFKCDFEHKIGEDTQQFCAMTFTLPCGEKVIAFRGTDSTLQGWKEDFDLAWNNEVPAQRSAANYIFEICNLYPNSDFSVAGHSKGGNLAVYSVLKFGFQKSELLKNLKSVYNFDGPGIRFDILDKYQSVYDKIKNKIFNYIPQTSVIGTMMSNREVGQYFCVHSKNDFISQHEPMSLVINPEFFKKDSEKFQTTEVKATAKAFEEAWDKIIKKLDKESAKRATEVLFRYLERNNLKTTDSFTTLLKKMIFDYLSGKSINEVLNIIFTPSQILELTGSEKQDLLSVFGMIGEELFISYWNYHEEINVDLNLSEETLNAFGDLKENELSKSKAVNIAWLMAKEYVKRSAFIQFFTKIFS